MKKIMAMLLSALVLTAFVGCSDDSESINREKPEGAVDSFFKASCEADVDAALACFPEEMQEYMIGEYDSKSEMKKELRKELKESIEEVEDDFGKYERYEFEIVESETIDRDQREYIEEQLNERGMDIKISSAKLVEVEYTIYFEDDEYEDSIRLELIKVDGQWYLYEGENLFN